MTSEEHWNQVYRTKSPLEVSWYQPWPSVSLDLITLASLPPDAAIIDVGAGASTLVDALLEQGDFTVTLLDLSTQALELSKTRLEATTRVQFLAADVLTADFPEAGYRLWHDRAVFHFLTWTADQVRYVQQAHRALAPGGFLVIGTFALDGPNRCSGLEAGQYSASSLSAVFSPLFRTVEARQEEHTTPGGQVQHFTFLLLQRQP